MITHTHEIRVRYSETDQMGFVYYGNYATYYEIGRAEAMRSVGIEYAKMEQDHGILMPVVAMHNRFIRPGRYDDILTIKTEVRKLPDQYITFDYTIFNSNKKLINGGSVRLCFLEASTQKRIPIPKYLLEIVSPYFE